jgi:hypothetical protein
VNLSAEGDVKRVALFSAIMQQITSTRRIWRRDTEHAGSEAISVCSPISGSKATCTRDDQVRVTLNIVLYSYILVHLCT